MCGGAIRSGKLAGRSMWSSIRVLALPILIQQTMAAAVGLVDTILGGQLPRPMVVPALDAIGIGSYITWFVGIAMTGLGVGGQAVIARAMGSGDRSESHRALGQSVVLSVAWGAVVGVLLWYAVEPVAFACRMHGEAKQFLFEYVRVIACSMPAAGLMLVGSMCLYGAGETTLPAIIAFAVNVVNIAVAWALSGVDLRLGGGVLANPFPFDLHVAGIAGGTAFSYLCGALMTLWALARGVRDLRLETRDLPLDRAMCARLVSVGAPGFFDSMMMWSANIVVLLVIGMVAAAEGAAGSPREGLQGAHLIAVRWEAFSYLPGFAVGTAAGALAGQYLGAGNPDMARRAILACTLVGCAIMGALGLVFMFGGAGLTAMISDETVHRAEAPALFFIAGLVQIPFASGIVMRQGLRGVGDTRWTFIITTVSSFGIRLPAAWLFGVVLGLGLRGVWIGLCGEIVLRGVFFAWRFFHGGWKTVKV